MVRIEHYGDIGYAVIVTESGDFKAMEFYPQDEGRAPMYQRDGSHTSPDMVEGISNAEVVVSGTVRFDGCINWRFDRQDQCMLHACGREELVAIGTLLARIHDVAGEMRLAAGQYTCFEPATTRDEREGA